MAQVPLGVIGVLRPWRQAGITHLLIEDNTLAILLKNGVSGRNHPSSVEEEQKLLCVNKKDQLVESKNNFISSLHTIPYPQSKVVKETGHKDGKDIVPIIPLKKWPSAWRDLLDKTPKSPFILWTYEELGFDLGGKASSERREILHRLLKDMHLAKGSHAFWPLCLFPDHVTPLENVQLFISGVHILKPSWIIFMTGKAPVHLGLPDFSLLIPQVCWGRYMVITQHIDELIQNELYYSQLLSFLKKHIQGSHTL